MGRLPARGFRTRIGAVLRTAFALSITFAVTPLVVDSPFCTGTGLGFESAAAIAATPAALSDSANAARRASPPAHGRVDCARCHSPRSLDQKGDGSSAPSSNRFIPSSAQACSGCHRPRIREGLSAGFHADVDRSCTDCHSFHETGTVRAADRTFDWLFSQESQETGTVADHCRTCHGPGKYLERLGSGHRAALALYHGGAERLATLSPSGACLTCHSVHTGPGRQAAGLEDPASEPPRFNELGSHPYGMVMRAGLDDHLRETRDPRLPLFSGRLECQTCHALTERTEDLLVPYPTKYELCLGCHQFQR